MAYYIIIVYQYLILIFILDFFHHRVKIISAPTTYISMWMNFLQHRNCYCCRIVAVLNTDHELFLLYYYIN